MNLFFFINNPKFLMGLAENNTKIFFDIDDNTNQDDLEYFSKWGKTSKNKILNYSNRTVNNLIISKCIIKKSDKMIGLALIKDDKKLFRFSIISEKTYFNNYQNQFINMVNSFEKVSTNPSISNIEPPKIRILKNSAKKGFIKEVIEKSGLQKKFAEDIFMTINEINDLETSQKIKTIY